MKFVKYPINTEKVVRIMEAENKLLFVVDRKATKKNIKDEVEIEFGVKVIKVNTFINAKGEKRAYVKLDPGKPAMDVMSQIGLM